MHISAGGIALIKQFEGLRLTRYLDSVGVPTIGFGTTEGDLGHPVPATCTLAQAEQWLRDGMAKTYEPPINALGVPLNQNEFDALCSFVYNCGPDSMSWQIGQDLRARNYKAASNDFMRYVFAGGQRLQGLVNRRLAEQRLFETPVPDPHGYQKFDKGPFGSPFGNLNERQLVVSYDGARAHWIKYRSYLNKTLRPQLAFLAARLDHLAYEQPAGEARGKWWAEDNRRFRRDQLFRRSQGQRFV